MDEQLTIHNVNVGDRVRLTKDGVWTHMIYPLQNMSLKAGALGTVKEVDREHWYIMVEWDEAPVLGDGTKQIVGHHYMPNFQPNGWNLKKVD